VLNVLAKIASQQSERSELSLHTGGEIGVMMVAMAARRFPRLNLSRNKKRASGFKIVIAVLLRFGGRSDERTRETRD